MFLTKRRIEFGSENDYMTLHESAVLPLIPKSVLRVLGFALHSRKQTETRRQTKFFKKQIISIEDPKEDNVEDPKEENHDLEEEEGKRASFEQGAQNAQGNKCPLSGTPVVVGLLCFYNWSLSFYTRSLLTLV
jgi:hypothetical protein